MMEFPFAVVLGDIVVLTKFTGVVNFYFKIIKLFIIFLRLGLIALEAFFVFFILFGFSYIDFHVSIIQLNVIISFPLLLRIIGLIHERLFFLLIIPALIVALFLEVFLNIHAQSLHINVSLLILHFF